MRKLARRIWITWKRNGYSDIALRLGLLLTPIVLGIAVLIFAVSYDDFRSVPGSVDRIETTSIGLRQSW